MDTAFIIGDSRMKGLQFYIDRINQGPVPIYVVKNSGKGLFSFTTTVINTTVNHPKARVILAGGICDCTFKNSNKQGEKFRFIFKDKDEMVNHLHDLFLDSNKKILQTRPEVKLAYSELIGMDMKASPYTVDPLPGQQDLFNSAIMEINSKIVTINKGNSTPTPWIAKRVHIERKNGTHHQYERLTKGIHWDEGLKEKCAEKFVDAIYKMY